ncbi:head-tail adaptor protein [Acuticoccus sediminis]|uniref:head-tail adaptor protein n=1 Tax=Acuticoccus sediminis TaxID=2184697 RepID=UPI001390763B|nr:head-tail adaptor protein [Acuticoccus sediminis]
MPAAGSLREQIRFDRRVEFDDGYGNTTAGWGAFAEGLPAAIEPVRGSEEVLAGKLTGLTPVTITIRWQPGLVGGADRLTTADRAVNVRSGDTFNIKSIEADPRRRWITLTCENGGADG